MSEVKRWRDTDHLERAVETAGGPEAFDLRSAECWTRPGWRLAELRRRRAMTQEQVATRDGRVRRAGVADRDRRRLHPGRAGPLHRSTAGPSS